MSNFRLFCIGLLLAMGLYAAAMNRIAPDTHEDPLIILILGICAGSGLVALAGDRKPR